MDAEEHPKASPTTWWGRGLTVSPTARCNFEMKGLPNVESENEKQGHAEPQTASEDVKRTPATPPPNASRRRIFIGLGVAAVVILGAALAMPKKSPSSTGSGTVDITLITSDRADVDCSAAAAVDSYRCGFSDENMPWHGDEQNKLKPFYTVDRHLYLIPGLFLQKAIQDRFNSEPPTSKARDQLKRFTARCQLKGIGKLGGTRVRWLSTGAWSNPEEADVATVVDCKVEG